MNVNDTDRGKIRNREYAQQLRNFSGLRFGKITPTDIDAFLEFGDKIFIIIESKHGDAKMLTGQRLALERLCDCCKYSGKVSYLLRANHNTSGDIDFAKLIVVEFYHNSKWTTPKYNKTIKEYIDKILVNNNYKIKE